MTKAVLVIEAQRQDEAQALLGAQTFTAPLSADGTTVSHFWAAGRWPQETLAALPDVVSVYATPDEARTATGLRPPSFDGEQFTWDDFRRERQRFFAHWTGIVGGLYAMEDDNLMAQLATLRAERQALQALDHLGDLTPTDGLAILHAKDAELCALLDREGAFS